MTDPELEALTFEQALAELERIVRDLEDGQTGLEESLARYERGVGLLKRCYGQLSQAEQRIVQLTGVDDDGRPITQPFGHAATTDTKPRLRARKPD
jgi:exodeoxyribonuclease VII small subunit